jgi:hypothetical protein
MLENHEFILRIEFSENRKQYNEEFNIVYLKNQNRYYSNSDLDLHLKKLQKNLI